MQDMCMSLLLHRVQGYGILLNPGDSRINPRGYVDNRFNYSMKGFIEWLSTEARPKEFDEIDCSVDQIVHFFPTALVISPPHFTKTEFETYHDDPYIHQDGATFLDAGLPGYRHLMDRRNGKQICGSLYQLYCYSFQDLQQPSKCSAEKLMLECTLTDLAEQMGFRCYDDVAENVVPCVPKIIIRFCEYLDLFNNPDTVIQLRPMVYSFIEPQ